MPKLICLSGMNKGDEYKLPDGCVVTIGRSEKNDICVFDKKSSRTHCRIHVQGQQVILEDLESTNGTKVNNEPFTGSGVIKADDQIRIGETVLMLSDRPVEEETDEDSYGKNQKKYENLMQKTAFQVTKTTTMRRLKTEKAGKETGFLSFFRKEDSE